MADDEELPEELEDQCEDCHKALTEVERLLNPLLSTSKAQTEEKVISARANSFNYTQQAIYQNFFRFLCGTGHIYSFYA